MDTKKQNNIRTLIVTIVALVAINFAAQYAYKRFDLTHDKRYTLSEATTTAIENVKEPLYIDIFLGGEIPPEFKRLQDETRQMLEEYKSLNDNIIFNFNDPLEDEEKAEQFVQDLYALGFTPTVINSTKQGKQSAVQVFPWAIANMGQKSVRIPLLVNNAGNSADENINKSVQLLEYSFTDAITKLTIQKKKKIAVLKGNGEIADKYMADFLMNLGEYYIIGEFSLDSLQDNQQKTLDNLKRFDLAIIAKPTEAFTDSEKYIFDQYIMGGGKSLWMIDKVAIDLDSLRNESQSTLAYPNNLNLDDMFFKYGARINYKLVQDLASTPITARSEKGDAPIDWLYSPIIKSQDNHPINKNINLVKLEFANQIDTLKNDIKKTVLLKSSPESKAVGAPVEVSLYQFMEGVDPSEYAGGGETVGVLMEGKFQSAFRNRIKPFDLKEDRPQGADNKMIIIADGDIVNYKYVNKKPLTNDLDQWTQQVYSNKDFLLNCVNYLLDDSGLINIRGKNVELLFLDRKKVQDEYTMSQLVTVGLPIAILAIFGVAFTWLRKRKYAR